MGMKNQKRIGKLISERWPKLKNRAQNENNPEKLISILEEIDDLLSTLEVRIASENTRSRGNSGLRSPAFFCDPPPCDSESGSQ